MSRNRSGGAAIGEMAFAHGVGYGMTMNKLILTGRGAAVALAMTMVTGTAAHAFDPLRLLGMTSSEKPEIDYKPRAPLVMPPEASLPPPQEPVMRRGDPQWPNDPDEQMREFVERRKAAIERGYEERLGSKSSDGPSRVLTPQELDQWAANAGLRGRAKSRTNDVRFFSGSGNSPVMSPQELRAGASAEVLPEGYVEPEREYLTDPPVGVRAAAAGAPVVKPETPLGQRPGTDRDYAREFKPNQ